MVIPNGYPPCFNYYLTDLKPPLGNFTLLQVSFTFNIATSQSLNF